MDFKKNAITLAIAGLAMAPVASFANSDANDVSMYASLRVALSYLDTEDNVAGNEDDQIDIVSRYSRVGIQGQTDLGNGLTGFAHYQWEPDIANTNTQNSSDSHNGADVNPTAGDNGSNNHDRTRLGYVGIKGGFGSIRLGHDYHTFYNHVVVGADWPWDYSGWAQVAYRGRTGETLTYAGDFGPVSVGVSLVIDGESQKPNTATANGTDTVADGEAIDEVEFGASFNAGPVKIGVGIITSNREFETGGTAGNPDFAIDNDPTSPTYGTIIAPVAGTPGTVRDVEDIYGLSVSGSGGPVSYALNYMQQDEGSASFQDWSSITFNLSVIGLYFHGEFIDSDGTNEDANLLSAGYTWNVGTNTQMWFEVAKYDTDAANDVGDRTAVQAAIKYDIK